MVEGQEAWDAWTSGPPQQVVKATGGDAKGKTKISYSVHSFVTRVSVSEGNDHNGMVRIFVGAYELIMVITSHTTSHTDCMTSYS